MYELYYNGIIYRRCRLRKVMYDADAITASRSERLRSIQSLKIKIQGAGMDAEEEGLDGGMGGRCCREGPGAGGAAFGPEE